MTRKSDLPFGSELTPSQRAFLRGDYIRRLTTRLSVR